MHSLRENAFIKIANEYTELRTINEVNTSNSHSCSPPGLIFRFQIKDCPSSLNNDYLSHSLLCICGLLGPIFGVNIMR